jgi:hypothetical protein
MRIDQLADRASFLAAMEDEDAFLLRLIFCMWFIYHLYNLMDFLGERKETPTPQTMTRSDGNSDEGSDDEGR